MKKLSILLVLLLLISSCKNKIKTDFKIGIISDCQYCNCEIKWNRYYKKSPQRLKEAIKELNKDSLQYTIHLGDFIDKDIKSLDSILPTWKTLKSESFHVLGNHDFEVEEHEKEQIIEKLNIKNRYYSFVRNNWRFIVLDGNDLSFYGAITPDKKKQTDSLFNSLKDLNLPYVKKWNGGLSNTQIDWLKSELEEAQQQKQLVGFYCHFPIYPIDQHNIWNRTQFLEVIKPYKNVKFFFNGHNHAGAYENINDIHYLTFKGMVDTENTSAFATAKFTKDTIFIEGYEREPSRKLVIQ
ncbi:metallophosphoesterase [Polaribacter dokdonensis]|uniref:Calcineurin-like phosphoesterase n=1 Tax=Polaribacter dokdonensis DSW-5 TaxID=1300348 RepID=A0A1H5HAF1_9FLAO|nr:metallophosphoesterase [Polaribacter dokdonensis]SEE25006.1 Calcineurin-like phosphoesterase [Polaribacter dokdonensis DSW-5]